MIDKTKDVLGLHSLDGVDLRSYISEIICYQNQELTFILTNGDKITVTWSNPSRRNSWTEEMKRAARQKTLERSSLSVTKNMRLYEAGKSIIRVKTGAQIKKNPRKIGGFSHAAPLSV